MTTCLFLDHQGKGEPFAEALRNAGYEIVTSQFQPFDFILCDTDIPARVKLFERAFNLHGKRTPVFIYPHAARPWVAGDGIFSAWPGTTAAFVGTQEHVNILRAYGYSTPLCPIGWTFSQQKPFAPAKKVERVLFAPIHPNHNGWLSPIDRDLNARAYTKLLHLVASGRLKSLTVRHIHQIDRNGLWPDRRARFVEGKPDGSCAENDAVDVVVAHQTYAYISIALGKPTVMFGEDVTPHCGNSPSAFQFVVSWIKYKDMLAYPLDLLHQDPMTVLWDAALGNEKVSDWRTRLIGEPFQPISFVATIKSYVEHR